MFPERMKIFNIGQVGLHDRPRFLSRSAKKVWRTLAQKLQISKGQIICTQIDFFKDYISAPRRYCAPKFLHALENDQNLDSAPPILDVGPLQFFFKGGQNLP